MKIRYMYKYTYNMLILYLYLIIDIYIPELYFILTIINITRDM